ncbi:hypothetical protein [Bacillus nakamurai]|uniref:hypothetical protein n=1 Tax=Bacillus nakamurai TaxID=1793963 RepID=UPI001E4B5410|nr:hypothetical protein [Bacillus nakamurai]MCC9023240.1 hypothetical protein [Bacillus nakamurai]
MNEENTFNSKKAAAYEQIDENRKKSHKPWLQIKEKVGVLKTYGKETLILLISFVPRHNILCACLWDQTSILCD